jgi:hypothetical protein
VSCHFGLEDIRKDMDYDLREFRLARFDDDPLWGCVVSSSGSVHPNIPICMIAGTSLVLSVHEFPTMGIIKEIS